MNGFCYNADGGSTHICLSEQFILKGVTPFPYFALFFNLLTHLLITSALLARRQACRFQLQAPFT